MLAIIIPYYKRSFFEEALESLANQTDKRFKVYIGDDASPENPTDLLEKYKGEFDFVYHRFESNLGSISLTQHWVRCIALSGNEKWIMVLGDDDVLGENVVKELYAFIDFKQGHQLDLIRFDLKIINKNGQLVSDDFVYEDHESVQKLLDRMFSIKETITASEFVFSRSIYNQNDGFVEFPLAWFSDYATWLIFGKASGIYNIRNESVYWRLSGINISSKSGDIGETKLKVKSLFLFMSFLKKYFVIEKRKQKEFVHAHLINLLRDIKFFQICSILSKYLYKYKFDFFEIIFEFMLKKIKIKIIKTYGDIYTTSKG